jgi:hypothetical protein
MAFVPRREHARFCSGRCRIRWNSGKTGDPVTEVSALTWSVQAMHDMMRRLPLMCADDGPRALAVIAEVVWQVTIVDATLVRYYPDAYDDVLAEQPRAERGRIEGTLSGLRFVRNQLRDEAAYADFVAWPGGTGSGGGSVTARVWQPVPEPALGSLPASGQAWETTRYRDYRSYLAGHQVGETFRRAAAFLRLAASGAPAVAGVSAAAAR